MVIKKGVEAMRTFFIGLLVVGLLVAVSASVEAKGPPVPPNATTVTDVCVVYEMDGVFSGGIPVVWPETVSYRYNGNDGISLWLPSQERLKVDWLGVGPLPPDRTCVGIV